MEDEKEYDYMSPSALTGIDEVVYSTSVTDDLESTHEFGITLEGSGENIANLSPEELSLL